MGAILRGLAICFEVAGVICEETAAWLADLGEDENDRDERLQRQRLDRLWQQSQRTTPNAAQ